MLEWIKTRRSIRKYQDRQIDPEQLDAILKSGLMAPTGRGSRPWEFIVVTDREKLETLSLTRGRSSQFLSGAPLGIVVAADQDKSTTWVEDAAIAAAFMQLTIHSLGLGSCWIHVRERQFDENKTAEDYVREALDIPESIRVLCILSIGFPAEDKPAHKQEDLLYERVHYDQF
ncbi:MAG TPA: NAD(P)H nitroreductase [Clostridiales bacterium]|jgi:nitroreductase|nr:NAD(P)H nitroreductase [Clostridiales bacterium]